MIDAVPYKNGQKNQWRRTVWKWLKENAGPGPVLYLPGSTDLDRAEAIRRGFKPADLIAVERDPEVATHLRSLGVTVINAGLLEVVQSWPSHCPIAALLADLQCGLDEWVLDFATEVARQPSLIRSAVVVNLQRGRDPFGVSLTPGVLNADGEDYCVCEVGRKLHPKHRGSGFYTAYFLALENAPLRYHHRMTQPLWDKVFALRDRAKEQALRGAVCPKTVASAAAVLADANGNDRKWGFLQRRFREVAFPASYRSTSASPLFDSVAFLTCGSPREPTQSGDPHTRRLIAAALALRTRKLRGELNGGRHKTI